MRIELLLKLQRKYCGLIEKIVSIYYKNDPEEFDNSGMESLYFMLPKIFQRLKMYERIAESVYSNYKAERSEK